MGLSASSQVLWALVLLVGEEGFQESSDFIGESHTFCIRFLFLFSLQVALHACGVATDMVMGHCIQAGAAFVISPCCYGFIQNAIKFTFPKRFVPAHLTPASPLRVSAFKNVISDLVVFLLDPCWHWRISSPISLSDLFWGFFQFQGSCSLHYIHTHSHSLSRIHTIYMSCHLLLFTSCLLSSHLTVWGSSVTLPSLQGPPLTFCQQQRIAFSMCWILQSDGKIQTWNAALGGITFSYTVLLIINNLMFSPGDVVS